MKLIIHSENGQYVALLRFNGLVANSTPQKTPKKALEGINHYKLQIPQLDKASWMTDPFGSLICDIWDGRIPKIDVLTIQINFQGLSKKTKQVLEYVQKIPRGKVKSYGEVASECGLPQAARYVGNVMATNRLPLIIPCHRVIHSDGRIGNYGGSGFEGRLQKANLLMKEGNTVDFKKFKIITPSKRQQTLRLTPNDN